MNYFNISHDLVSLLENQFVIDYCLFFFFRLPPGPALHPRLGPPFGNECRHALQVRVRVILLVDLVLVLVPLLWCLG